MVTFGMVYRPQLRAAIRLSAIISHGRCSGTGSAPRSSCSRLVSISGMMLCISSPAGLAAASIFGLCSNVGFGLA